ncbi:MAG: hypothetical protein VX610_04755 [SAR324 cluster bacterium]|nr:hypothetical protein [SAR324 cluster bacterium]
MSRTPSRTQREPANPDHVQAKRFLQRIRHYRSTTLSRNQSAPDATEVLQGIFKASGHHHLMVLAKLRKLWFESVDRFLAQNAFPRNFSVTKNFAVTQEWLQRFAAQKPPSELLGVLERIRGRDFSDMEHLLKTLSGRLDRVLAPAEEQLIRGFANFRVSETVLHVTVYDGSIAQAIQFEMPSYLKLLRRLLPEMRVDRIRCHVGDLGQVKADQQVVAELAEAWLRMLPKEVGQRCAPAFVHRASKRQAVLVLLVESEAIREELIRVPGLEWLHAEIVCQHPAASASFSRVALAVRSGTSAQHVLAHSMALAAPLTETSSPQPEKPPSPAQRQVRRILDELRTPETVSGVQDSSDSQNAT